MPALAQEGPVLIIHVLITLSHGSFTFMNTAHKPEIIIGALTKTDVIIG
jgi:hypothetical protein